MNILVTAGNTQTPIDRVRCITNIFSGKTGTRIAAAGCERGHAVTLLTSHPELVRDLLPPLRFGEGGLGGEVDAARSPKTPPPRPLPDAGGGGGSPRGCNYRTFDDLEALISEVIPSGQFDAIVHAAAVSDYHLAGIYSKTDDGMKDASAGKVKSSHAELWLHLLPTPKLIDKIRKEWGFRGTLVKFKLEVGVSEAELIDIAERSRLQSGADLMAANTLEGMNEWAYVGAGAGGFQKVQRDRLAEHLLEAIERTT